MKENTHSRPHWASRMGFILAAAGSAVGLGNIWKFPYITGQNGGGAFVLVYLLCILIIGMPIMMAEFLIGRKGQKDAVGSFVALEGKNSPWRFVGWMGVFASFLLLSFYSVVAGWCFDFTMKAFAGAFTGAGPDDIKALFGSLVSAPGQVVLWQALFLIATVAVVMGGIRGGIERWSKILMPVLFVLLVFLFINGMLSDGAGKALHFMFSPDFSKLTPASIMEAMGHAFFTLSVGAGVMITYGSYLEADADLFSLSVRIAFLDTLVALLSGLAIFSVVFAAGLEPGAGPGLVFQTIPLVFSNIPFGEVLAVLFFILLSFAALSSSISMLEVAVAYLIDEKGLSRKLATITIGAGAFLLGIPCALSFNLWSGFTPFFGKTFFDFFDLLVSSYLLPLGGLFVALYVGWSAGTEGRLLEFFLKYVAPVSVVVILLHQVGVI